MQKEMGQPVVVMSRPGAGGAVGVEAVVRAPADGYTFVLSSSGNIAINPHVLKLKYDPVSQLRHVTILTELPFVFVKNNSFPAKDLNEFLIYAKQHPNEVRMGNGGLGSHQHLTQVMFAKTAGISINIIPYKGSAPATSDLMGGHIESIIDNVGTQKPLIESGRVSPLFVTSAERVPSMPKIPTAQELGLPFTAVAWFGLAAPAGTPDAIVNRVQAILAAAFGKTETRMKLEELAMTPIANDPSAATQRVKGDFEKYGKAVTEFGVKLD
jgi:tripartite-type tricarboxylate transporter receptor subunit TctC